MHAGDRRDAAKQSGWDVNRRRIPIIGNLHCSTVRLGKYRKAVVDQEVSSRRPAGCFRGERYFISGGAKLLMASVVKGHRLVLEEYTTQSGCQF